jgi:hypothetical protein
VRWITSNAKEALMKKPVKTVLLLLAIFAALVIAAQFISFDLLVRKLHGG